MITEASLQSGIKVLRDYLAGRLADHLGLYRVGLTEIPAIWVIPPDLPQSYQVVPDSGIECVINAEPIIKQMPLIGRVAQQLHFEVLLKQWKPRAGLLLPTQVILNDGYFTIHQDPVIRPYQEINGEIFYGQARINLIVTDLNLFS